MVPNVYSYQNYIAPDTQNGIPATKTDPRCMKPEIKNVIHMLK